MPQMAMVPLVAVSRWVIARRSVDLPEPDGPMMASTSPWCTEKEMSEMTRTSP